jgi:hypothetical protein
MNLKDFIEGSRGLTGANRPIHLRLWQEKRVLDDVLLVKRVTGSETLCPTLWLRSVYDSRGDSPSASAPGPIHQKKMNRALVEFAANQALTCACSRR